MYHLLGTLRISRFALAALVAGVYVAGTLAPSVGETADPVFARSAEANPAEAATMLDAALSLYAASPLSSDLSRASHAAVAKGVSPDALSEFLHRAGENEYPPADLLIAVGRLGRVAASDLPVDPVLSRYLQGMAKHVPSPRVEAAVGALEIRLKDAAVLIDAAFPAQELDRDSRLKAVDHGAYAIQVGVPIEVFDRALSLARGDSAPLNSVQAPLLAMGVLSASGVDPDRSMDLVSQAWSHGIRGPELEQLGKTVGVYARYSGGDAGEVVTEVIRMLESDLTSDRIFAGLDTMHPEARGQLPPGADPTVVPGNRRIGDRPQETPRGPEGDSQFAPWEGNRGN